MPYINIILIGLLFSISGITYNAHKVSHDTLISATTSPALLEDKDTAKLITKQDPVDTSISITPSTPREQSPEPVTQALQLAITTPNTLTTNDAPQVPFFSQFQDISSPKWQKLGCGITSLAMLIEFYDPGSISVDSLLSEGISAGAFLEGSGWIHSGLVKLAENYNLRGTTYDLSQENMDTAIAKLEHTLKDGPVIASVHYTFNPQNPIPHLAVIDAISDGVVYINDPAGKHAGETISLEKFKSAWKKRYIAIYPTTI